MEMQATAMLPVILVLKTNKDLLGIFTVFTEEFPPHPCKLVPVTFSTMILSMLSFSLFSFQRIENQAVCSNGCWKGTLAF